MAQPQTTAKRGITLDSHQPVAERVRRYGKTKGKQAAMQPLKMLSNIAKALDRPLAQRFNHAGVVWGKLLSGSSKVPPHIYRVRCCPRPNHRMQLA
ncbi:MAG: hypothetical protein P8M25_09060 [Paracoccaceae bacterium]|nr:hypothetical protein [Paracoccaceae bacterium]